jgi:hypothetical protein
MMHVVCPLEFERSVLARLGRNRGWTFACSGPGAAGIDRWAAGPDAPPPGARGVLAGLAGAIAPLDASKAVVPGKVIDGAEGAWVPTLPGAASQPLCCVGLDHVLGSVEAKDRAARAHHADIVDMESAAFARAAEARQWQWAVVRGISDTVDESLPKGIEGWVDDRGRLRIWHVVRALMANPFLLRRLHRLRTRSLAGLAAADAALRALDAGRTAAINAGTSR